MHKKAVVGVMLIGGGVAATIATVAMVNHHKPQPMAKMADTITYGAQETFGKAGDAMIHMGKALNRVGR